MHTADTTHLTGATSVALIMSGFVLFLYGLMLSGDSFIIARLLGVMLIGREGSALQNVSVMVDAVSGGTWAALFMASALIVFGVLLRVRHRIHL